MRNSSSEISALELVPSRHGGGYGVRATRDIAPGELFAIVDHRLVLDQRATARSAVSPAIDYLFELSGEGSVSGVSTTPEALRVPVC